MFESIPSVVLSVVAGIVLAAATGLRAFLPLCVLSFSARFGVVQLHDNFAFLESNVALVALCVAAVLELVADKIPLVDHTLDAIGVFVRPAVAFVAGLALMADLPQVISVVLSLFAATVALGTHVEHAKVRAGSTVVTAGLGNPVLSFFEDLISGLLSVLALLAPIIALILLIAGFEVARRVVRRVRKRQFTPR